jgi:hypothetical protein
MASESSLSSSISTAVRLPPRTDTADNRQKPPVWALDSEPAVQAPTPSNCARQDRTDGVCCKELKYEQRTLIDPDIVRDV